MFYYFYFFKQIERLLNEGRVPVIVGGTHYYIESLLWKVLLDDEGNDQSDSPLLYDKSANTTPEGQPVMLVDDDDDDLLLKKTVFDQDGVEHLTSPRLHRLLKMVDPDMADAIHPNNRRKIIR